MVSHPCDSPPASNFYGRILISLRRIYIFRTCCSCTIPRPPLISTPLYFTPSFDVHNLDILILVDTGSIPVRCDTIFCGLVLPTTYGISLIV